MFHPSQPTYANLPPLPSRYASLVLPADWYLPGKEKRRKRKHRRTHGAISFQELSLRIASAWKVLRDDSEIKAYCAEVYEAGMRRYSADVSTWRRQGREPSQPTREEVVDTESSRQPANLSTVDMADEEIMELWYNTNIDETAELESTDEKNESPAEEDTPSFQDMCGTTELARAVSGTSDDGKNERPVAEDTPNLREMRRMRLLLAQQQQQITELKKRTMMARSA